MTMTVSSPSPETAPSPSSDWRHAALCRKYDPELWHPIGTTGPARAQTMRAVRICRECPSRMPCAEWAIEELEYGVAGGLTEQDRAQVRADRSPGQFGLPIVGVS